MFVVTNLIIIIRNAMMQLPIGKQLRAFSVFHGQNEDEGGRFNQIAMCMGMMMMMMTTA